MIQSQRVTSSVFQLPMQTNDASITDKLKARQDKRVVKAAERRQKSDKLTEEGNVFFRDGNHLEAAECYQQAFLVHGNAAKPALLTNLAAVYLKLNMYDAAHKAADQALAADPKSLDARFHRGVARRHLEMMTTAAVDFGTVLRLAPDNREAQQELALVQEGLPEDDVYEKNVCFYSDHEAPAPDEEGYLSESMSESSDCEHTGNGVPCKFYNRAGCAKGGHCRFSHAPDNQSKRDGLGRNVCVYYLMGVCKFGAEKCNYAHSKEYLPPKGWWATSEGADRAQKIYKVRKMIGNASVASGHGINSSKKHPKPRPKARGTSKESSFGKKKVDPRPPPRFYDRASESLEWGEEEDEYNEFGFKDSDMQELISHGVKPWDDDAWDFLHALHNL